MGVLISPGEMTVARMPLTDSSRSTIFVNTDIPCLEALYAVPARTLGWVPALSLIHISEPTRPY